MTLAELLTKLDDWIASLSEKLNDGERLGEQLVTLDGNAVAGIVETLRHARAVALWANGED